MKIIDVSHWQGNINFANVKKDGIEGVIIKAGGSDKGFYTDNKFNTNYTNAINNGLHVGAYYYVGSKCLSKEDGKEDADRFINIINGKKFDLPVYMDVEEPNKGQKDKVTNAIIGFCEEMESKGYYVGVYASDISGFKDMFNYDDIKDKYTLWVARYGSKPKYATKYDVWQYSSTGKVNGISGNVDMDECYVDFPSIITKGGFNGYGKGSETKTSNPEPKPVQPSNQQTSSGITYVVKKGDTLSGIASKYKTTYQVLASYNGISNPNLIGVGQAIKIPNGTMSHITNTSSRTYIVKSGDTLSSIAKKYGTTYQKIAKDNNISNPNKIYPGQKLTINN